MFTVTDTVREHDRRAAVDLTPYGRVTRLGEPKNHGYFILHEGLIGVFGDRASRRSTTRTSRTPPSSTMPPVKRGWLGITDKYWATAMMPPRDADFTGRFVRVDRALAPLPGRLSAARRSRCRPAARAESTSQLFAGAKQVSVVGMNWLFVRHRRLRPALDIERFELLIDWGWFYFITKPMFFLIDWLFRLFGNFGVAILARHRDRQGASSSRSPTSPTSR